MSTFGNKYKITTFGESHSNSVGGIIEGFPSLFKIDFDKIQEQLNRRRPQNKYATPRKEPDKIVWLSGFEKSLTLGTPIGFQVENQNIKPNDYISCQKKGNKYIPRPGHADLTYLNKYGIHASSGGGRSSARETISRVVAGSLADQYLEEKYNCRVVAWVSQIGEISLSDNHNNSLINNKDLSRQEIDNYSLRCPDVIINSLMEDNLDKIIEEKNSIGGIVNCVVINPPKNLGEPCFDKFEALLAHAMLSIPASKAFEIGKGFKCCEMKGSQHNDPYELDKHLSISSITNNAGGTLGGITTGKNIYFRVGFKPASTISQLQNTINILGEEIDFVATGRHDPCVVTRAVPVIEGMTSIVLLDLLYRNYTY